MQIAVVVSIVSQDFKTFKQSNKDFTVENRHERRIKWMTHREQFKCCIVKSLEVQILK